MRRLLVSVLPDDPLPDSEQSLANVAAHQLPHLTRQIAEVPERRRDLLGLVVERRPDLALPDEMVQLAQIRNILRTDLHVVVNVSPASDHFESCGGASQAVMPDAPAGDEAVAEVVVVAGLGHERLKSGLDVREQIAGVEGDGAGLMVIDLDAFEDEHLLLAPVVTSSSPFFSGCCSCVDQSVSIQVNLQHGSSPFLLSAPVFPVVSEWGVKERTP